MNGLYQALLIAAMILAGFALQRTTEPDLGPEPVGPPVAITSAQPFGPADRPVVKTVGYLPDMKFIQRHAYYLRLAGDGHIDAYFIGDSIIDAWQAIGKPVWDREFSGWRAGNFACSGDQTQHALWRLTHGELNGVKPKLFVVLIGTNNLFFNTDEEIVAGNTAILRHLRKTNPQAKILLLGLLPRSDGYPETGLARIRNINEQLARLADGRTIRFIDVGPRFLDKNGQVPKSLMPDGLHPNVNGYTILADAIKPVLRQVLGPPTPRSSP